MAYEIRVEKIVGDTTITVKTSTGLYRGDLEEALSEINWALQSEYPSHSEQQGVFEGIRNLYLVGLKHYLNLSTEDKMIEHNAELAVMNMDWLKKFTDYPVDLDLENYDITYGDVMVWAKRLPF